MNGGKVMAGSIDDFFNNRSRHGGKKVFTNRIGDDGVPFRGFQPPNLREDEYDQRVVRVAEPRVEEFDMTQSKDKQRYLTVLKGAAEGYFRIIFLDRFHKGSTKHYVEWIEFYNEDGQAAKMLPQNITEVPGV